VTASLTPNREGVLGALWWLYDGALFGIYLADTSGAATPPALDGSFYSWLSPTDYFLDSAYDIYVTGDAVAYDATITDRAVLPQLEITLDYATTVTYTDLLVVVYPAQDGGATPPDYSIPLVAVIHESSPVTLLSTETKTYKLDLFAEWL